MKKEKKASSEVKERERERELLDNPSSKVVPVRPARTSFSLDAGEGESSRLIERLGDALNINLSRSSASATLLLFIFSSSSSTSH